MAESICLVGKKILILLPEMIRYKLSLRIIKRMTHMPSKIFYTLFVCALTLQLGALSPALAMDMEENKATATPPVKADQSSGDDASTPA